jgi:hypothetical protein
MTADEIARIRAEALEEAARVAEVSLNAGYLCPYGRDVPGDPTWRHTDKDICPVCRVACEDSSTKCHDMASGRIAAAIRALIPSPPKEPA